MAILIGVVEIVLDLLVQSLTVALIFRLLRRSSDKGAFGHSFGRDTRALSQVMVVLFLNHIVQIGLWAVSFRIFGEFPDFNTAFYHSAVNYTSLGYGDIVMSEEWRILGALEAASGVLMFGVSTATFFAIMRYVFSLRQQSEIPGQRS